MKQKFYVITTIFLWFIILLSPQFLQSLRADNGAAEQFADKGEKEKPSMAEIATEAISIIMNPQRFSWHKMKTLLNKLQIKLSPPNLDFRGSSNEVNPVEEMKEGVKKSFGSSKSAVGESARSAAEAVQKTAEKVKESMSDDDKGSKSEL